MTLETRVAKILGIRHPIVQAPMAGGPTTPGLVAAVSNAGGLDFLGAAYLAPEKLREAVREIRALTERPFGINLFVTSPFEADPKRIRRANALLEPYRDELGVETPGEFASFEESFEDQLEVVLEERVPVFGFTFGVPSRARLSELRGAGITTVGTATTVREGVRLQDEGVDAVVAQGSEAGGRRGTFLGDHRDALIGTMALVPQMVDTLSVPVIAPGGIVDGRGLAAALILGAEAVQMGTAFLASEESGAHPAFKRAVLVLVLSTRGAETVAETRKRQKRRRCAVRELGQHGQSDSWKSTTRGWSKASARKRSVRREVRRVRGPVRRRAPRPPPPPPPHPAARLDACPATNPRASGGGPRSRKHHLTRQLKFEARH